ncbi:uncharacterized protein [Cardiocondyla obscurior]
MKRARVIIGSFRDYKITVGVFASDLCAEGWLVTSHLRGGAGPGRASCIGGATFSHRQNSTPPLKLMQMDGNPEEDFCQRSTSLTSPLEWPVLRGGGGLGKASGTGGVIH